MNEIWNPEYETMSRDELRELQFKRLQMTLRWTYDNVPFHRDRWSAMKLKPGDIRSLDDVTQAARSRSRATSRPPIPTASSRCRWRRSSASTPPRGPSPTRPWSATAAATSTPGRNCAPAWPWPAASTRTTWPRSAFEYGLTTGAFGMHAGLERVGVDRGTRPPRATPSGSCKVMRDFKTTVLVGTPSYVMHLTEVAPEPGLRPRRPRPAGGSARLGAVDQPDAGRDRAAHGHVGQRHLRAVRGHRPGRLLRVLEQGRAARERGPLPGGGGRPGDRRTGARRQGGRTGLHLAHQGGSAGDPLPDAATWPASATGPAPAGGSSRGTARCTRAPTTCSSSGASTCTRRPSRPCSPRSRGWSPATASSCPARARSTSSRSRSRWSRRSWPTRCASCRASSATWRSGCARNWASGRGCAWWSRGRCPADQLRRVVDQRDKAV